MEKRTKITIVVVAVVIVILFLFSTQSAQRWIKDLSSDYTGGLNRTVTVYDYNGKKLGEWTGKFDVEYKDNGSIKFDKDGKRTIITNGITINEEN